MLYGWKENSMLTNCLAACAHLSITVSEIQRDIWEKIGILSYPLAFDAPVRGSRRNIGTPFGIGKLEWCCYPTVKNFEDIFVHFGATPERDRQTDGRTPGDGNSHAMHSIAQQKLSVTSLHNKLSIWLQWTQANKQRLHKYYCNTK